MFSPFCRPTGLWTLTLTVWMPTLTNKHGSFCSTSSDLVPRYTTSVPQSLGHQAARTRRSNLLKVREPQNTIHYVQGTLGYCNTVVLSFAFCNRLSPGASEHLLPSDPVNYCIMGYFRDGFIFGDFRCILGPQIQQYAKKLLHC